MNETFSDTKSFIWRLPSPYNNKAFSFEAQHFCFFGQSHVSLKFKVKNHKNNFTFRLLMQHGCRIEFRQSHLPASDIPRVVTLVTFLEVESSALPILDLFKI